MKDVDRVHLGGLGKHGLSSRSWEVVREMFSLVQASEVGENILACKHTSKSGGASDKKGSGSWNLLSP